MHAFLPAAVFPAVFAEATDPWPAAIGSMIVAAITVTGTVIVAFVNSRKAKKEVESAENRADELQAGIDNLKAGILQAEPIQSGDKRNAIILAGLGGSGKTTMIRSLTHDLKAEPAVRTEDFMIFRAYRSIGELVDGRQKHCWLYIADYPGANLSSLIRQFLLEQKKPFSPLAYGHISSLVLIVDVREPSPDHEVQPMPEPEPDEHRIEKHMEQWSDMALDALFGLLTRETLKYVCLFINKSDLVMQKAKSSDENTIKRFGALTQRIAKRCTGLQFEIIYGSAKTGDGLNQLIQHFIEFSYEPQNNA